MCLLYHCPLSKTKMQPITTDFTSIDEMFDQWWSEISETDASGFDFYEWSKQADGVLDDWLKTRNDWASISCDTCHIPGGNIWPDWGFYVNVHNFGPNNDSVHCCSERCYRDWVTNQENEEENFN